MEKFDSGFHQVDRKFFAGEEVSDGCCVVVVRFMAQAAPTARNGWRVVGSGGILGSWWRGRVFAFLLP